MTKLRYLLLLLPLSYLQCKKLSTLPDYKSPAGTKLDILGIQPRAIEHSDVYTYILDNSPYQRFYRISESDGKTENIERFNTIQAFAADDQYLYILRKNVYPVANASLYKVHKANFADSQLLNANAPYKSLSYYDGSLYGWADNLGLMKISTAGSEATVMLSNSNFSISQPSFSMMYNNSSVFYNGYWLFVNGMGGGTGTYLTKVKLDGSQNTDTIQAVRSPIFAVYNDRIYFSYRNPNNSALSQNATAYSSCLASIPFNGGSVVIEDSVNLMHCNTVRVYGSKLLIGDGRFIKTFDPASHIIVTIGAMESSPIAGTATATAEAYPFCNSYSNSVYYASYMNTGPLYKLK